jgi:hypothetical protein
MRRVIPITEQFQHVVAESKESFWGDGYGRTRQVWQKLLRSPKMTRLCSPDMTHPKKPYLTDALG